MEIKKLLTKVNFNKGNNRKIEYIVIHYTGNNEDTSYNNAMYFKDINRNASAHYFVDENEIYQVVEDKDIAWSVGKDYSDGKAPLWNICTNNNSINIEMCSCKKSNGDFYIPKSTITNTINLVKDLMKKYNIKTKCVVRHFDVTYKRCPEPFVRDYTQWEDFLKKLDTNNELMEAIDIVGMTGINTDFWKQNYNTQLGLQCVPDLFKKIADYLK